MGRAEKRGSGVGRTPNSGEYCEYKSSKRGYLALCHLKNFNMRVSGLMKGFVWYYTNMVTSAVEVREVPILVLDSRNKHKVQVYAERIGLLWKPDLKGLYLVYAELEADGQF